MSGSNAKRKQQQQRQAQKRAAKSHERDRTQSHQHLPKVGTKADRQHLHERRQADLFDFGLVKVPRWLGLVVIALVLAGLVGLLAILVLSD